MFVGIRIICGLTAFFPGPDWDSPSREQAASPTREQATFWIMQLAHAAAMMHFTKDGAS